MDQFLDIHINQTLVSHCLQTFDTPVAFGFRNKISEYCWRVPMVAKKKTISFTNQAPKFRSKLMHMRRKVISYFLWCRCTLRSIKYIYAISNFGLQYQLRFNYVSKYEHLAWKLWCICLMSTINSQSQTFQKIVFSVWKDH